MSVPGKAPQAYLSFVRIMQEIKLIDIREAILSDNDNIAGEIRNKLRQNNTFMLNLMGTPGAGKTSFLIKTIDALSEKFRIGVIEGDIESSVDAEKISAKNIPTVQLRTGGACHLDAAMIDAAADKLDIAQLDLIIIENIGNLVCPAEFDTGSNIRVMVTSVPEGDDKILKYPLMFSVCEAIIVNKIDYLPDPGFDLELLEKRIHNLNPRCRVFPISCRESRGLDDWTEWLAKHMADFQNELLHKS